MNMLHPFYRWRARIALGALLLVVVLPGCDSGGSGDETLVLNDPANPTEATFVFPYTESDFNNGVVTVESEEQDQLSEVLSAYGGYSRSDVISARVEEVHMERETLGGTAAAAPATKVFEYLSRVEVYMGTSTNAPLIGVKEPIPSNPPMEITLDAGPDRDVTSQVQSGPTRARLRLSLDDPSQIGSGGDRVEVTVRFRIEVQP